MYLRLVHVKAKAERLAGLQKLYDERILPALQETPGCVSACLIKSHMNPEEVISLTIWQNEKHAQEYVSKGLFQKLLDDAKPLLEASEWKIRLSKTMNGKESPPEPKISSYEIVAASHDRPSAGKTSPAMFMRITTAQVRPGRYEELRSVYVHEILPILKNMKGCKDAYLTAEEEGGHNVLSITFWESKSDAEAYERGGTFQTLVRKIQHTITEVYRWGVELERASRVNDGLPRDLTIEEYFVVTGRNFPQ
jgi:heme-degrading monooxygenase HmoA